VERLLTVKKTELLRGFVSMRTRRKFSAYLVMGADGKTSFEFEPRPEGGKGRRPFPKKPAPGDGGEGEGAKSVTPKNVIKKGSRKKA
jgi:DNA topoisomerase-3